jgi:hypothetical protein
VSQKLERVRECHTTFVLNEHPRFVIEAVVELPSLADSGVIKIGEVPIELSYIDWWKAAARRTQVAALMTNCSQNVGDRMLKRVDADFEDAVESL